MEKFPHRPIQKIAVISDVHANLPALEAVYLDALKSGAQLLINAGDSIGYGPFPNETLDFIRDHHIYSVLGDYDKKVLIFPQKEKKWAKSKDFFKFISFQWSYQTLKEENISYLNSLPIEKKMQVNQKEIFITHGSPTNIKDYITDSLPHQELINIAHEVNSDIIITGNTHKFLKKIINGTYFINPGSVGRQDDDNPSASYALIKIDYNLSIIQKRIPYQIETVINELRKMKLPKVFELMFIKGVNLDRAIELLS